MDWKEWLLDVTHGTDPFACFVPYEREDDAIVFGMNLMTDRCPGDLVGVIHAAGQEAVEKWMADNPDWHERHKRRDNIVQK
jgi:hypothetical protein